ncbi:MAG: hypothetical protein JXA49_06135 [Actinobacteria bacterium]|nr:hypothetical protein [Actinomycetota bacterium]
MMKRTVIVVLLLAVVTAAAGCGSGKADTTPVKTTRPDSLKAYDIAGPWIVKDQPESRYYITFRPEGTYGAVVAGVTSEGTFVVNRDIVRLIATGGDQLSYRYVKGAEMMQDQLVGDITWVRRQ